MEYTLFKAEWYARELAPALEAARQALRLGALSESPALQERAALGMASLLLDLGDLEGMVSAAQFVLDSKPNRLRWTLAHNAIGTALKDQGRFEQARAYLRQAARYLDAKEVKPYAYDIMWNLATVEIEGGAIEEAQPWVNRVLSYEGRGERLRYPSKATLRTHWNLVRGHHSEAIAEAERALQNNPDPSWAMDLATYRGRAYEALGDLASARASYEEAIRFLEELRSASIPYERFRAARVTATRAPFEQLFVLSESAEEKAHVLDRTKGRIFESSFAQTPEMLEREIADSQSLADRIGPSQTWLAEALRVLPILHTSRELDPLPWAQTAASVRARQVLAWFFADDSVYLVGAWQGEIRVLSLGGAEEIRRLTRRLRARPSDRELARQLGRKLLPVEIDLDPRASVYLIPDKALAGLPLGLLERRPGRRFVQGYQLAYVPSFSSVEIFARRAKDTDPEEPPIVLAAGEDLAHARTEAAWVGTHLAVTPFLDAVTTDLWRAKRVELLHVATHGGVGHWTAFLKLRDREVFPSDILRQSLSPRTVVLASCASAAPKDGNLWSSVAGAFLASGTQTVLASLWSVSDAQAERFVQAFYEAGGAQTPLASATRAQRQMIEEGRPVEAWAPFVVLGAITNEPSAFRSTEEGTAGNSRP